MLPDKPLSEKQDNTPKVRDSGKIPVRVVSRKGDSAIVEYTDKGMLERVVIAHSVADSGTLSVSELKDAAPYGLPIGKFVSDKSLGTRLQLACRQRGLWTLQDFEKNPQFIQAALQEALSLDVGTILEAARHFDEG